MLDQDTISLIKKAASYSAILFCLVLYVGCATVGSYTFWFWLIDGVGFASVFTVATSASMILGPAMALSKDAP